MTSQDLDKQIDRLERLRNAAAASSRELADRELDGRLMRADLIQEHRNTGSTRTEAETLAKISERYIKHERRSIEIAYMRDLQLAQVEATRFRLELSIAAAQTASVV